MSDIFLECPHCKSMIIINTKDFNCKIFRHGVYKNNNKQIYPHLNKNECDRLFNEKLIYGCGKPFKLIDNNGNYHAEICDYI